MDDSRPESRVYPAGQGANLPRYSMLSIATLPVYPEAEELDISSEHGNEELRTSAASRRSFEFASSAPLHGGAPSVSLQLLSNAPPSSQRPRYIAGERVEGSINLNFEKPQAVKTITVQLRGRVVTSAFAEGSHVFLEHSLDVWNARTGTLPTPRPGAHDRSQLVGGKLKGKFSLPFEFTFPTEFSVTLKKGDTPMVYPTPQTVMEKGIYATIVYEVIAKVAGGFLRGTQKIVANVLYVPILKAPALPPLRAAAYASGSSLCCPTEDPDGWTLLPQFRVRVTAIENNAAKIPITLQCLVYIANPTVYTRGTVLPCYLSCRVTNDLAENEAETASHFMEAFLFQGCVSASLTRAVDISDARSTSTRGQHGIALVSGDRSRTVSDAVWWRPQGQDGTGKTLSAEGEIHLSRALLPSCELPFVRISYAVSVSVTASSDLNVESIGDSTSNGQLADTPASAKATKGKAAHRSTVVSSMPVKICTVKGDGPMPLPFTPRPPPEILDRVLKEKNPGAGIIASYGRDSVI